MIDELAKKRNMPETTNESVTKVELHDVDDEDQAKIAGGLDSEPKESDVYKSFLEELRKLKL